MNELVKSQMHKLFLLTVFFFITHLLSTAMKPSYLYLLLNVLIISLGTQTGLLSFQAVPLQNNNNNNNKPVSVNPVTKEESSSSDSTHQKLKEAENPTMAAPKLSMAGLEVDNKVKISPSLPTLFFIGAEEAEALVETVEEVLEDEEEEELGGLSGQELFTKAEIFIGNFYKQLKIQREESWNKIHGFYQHKSF